MGDTGNWRPYIDCSPSAAQTNRRDSEGRSGCTAASTAPAAQQPPRLRLQSSLRSSGCTAASAAPAAQQPPRLRLQSSLHGSGCRAASTAPAAEQPPRLRLHSSLHGSGCTAASTAPAAQQPPRLRLRRRRCQVLRVAPDYVLIRMHLPGAPAARPAGPPVPGVAASVPGVACCACLRTNTYAPGRAHPKTAFSDHHGPGSGTGRPRMVPGHPRTTCQNYGLARNLAQHATPDAPAQQATPDTEPRNPTSGCTPPSPNHPAVPPTTERSLPSVPLLGTL